MRINGNPESVQENETQKILWTFAIQADHLISARHSNNREKKRTCWIGDFAVLADHSIKLKEKREINTKTLQEKKKQHSKMKVKVIPIVTGALGKVTRILVQGLDDLEIRGRVEAIQSTVLLRSDRSQKKFLVNWGDMLSLRIQWNTIH